MLAPIHAVSDEIPATLEIRQLLAIMKDMRQRVKNFFKGRRQRVKNVGNINGTNDRARLSQSTKPHNDSSHSITVVSLSAGPYAAGDLAQRPFSSQRIIGDENQDDANAVEALNGVTEQAQAPVNADTPNSEGASIDNIIADLTPVLPSSPPTTAVAKDDTNQIAGQNLATNEQAVTPTQNATITSSTGTAPVTHSVAASSPPSHKVPAHSTTGDVPQLVQQSSHAPKWFEALKTMQKDDPTRYSTLNKIINIDSPSPDDKIRKILSLSEDKHKPKRKALLQRVQAILPSLATTRTAAMTVASADPHHIAPLVVAGTFFILDIMLGRLGLDDERKIQNMVFECANAVNEWISFEANFFERTSAVENKIQDLEGLLPDYYKRALELLCDLYAACNSSWSGALGNKLSAKMEDWKREKKELKDCRENWSARRKVMEEVLSREKNVAEVLDWIKSPDDPEQSFESLSDRITSEGRYKDAASWFFESPAFSKWSRHFYPFDTAVGTESGDMHKRVLWVSGAYGTGKTTIIHRSVSELKSLAEGQLTKKVFKKETRQPKRLHVISYFCESSKRVSYETIVRSIARKLAFMPDFTLAPAAREFYNTKRTQLRLPIYYKNYEDLVRQLLDEISKSYNVALVIDALNECDPPKDAEPLCELLNEIVRTFPHVSVLFSSHENMYIPEQFQKLIEEVNVIKSAPADGIEEFVKAELKYRDSKLKNSGGVFIQDQELRDELEPSLIDQEFCDELEPLLFDQELRDELEQSLIDHANGMYLWVQIWLDITLPIKDNANTVRLYTHARELLNELKDSSAKSNNANSQLQAGYQRLWQLGSLGGLDEIRQRLFRLVACAFEPLSIVTVASVLRINIDNEDLYFKQFRVSDIRKLCSNFLSEDKSERLTWTHDSARDFIFRVILNPGIDLTQPSAYEDSIRDNHLLVVNMFISVMRSRNHPIWQELRLEELFSQWWKQQNNIQLENHSGKWPAAMEKATDRNSGLGYITDYGRMHCQSAAKEQALSDPVWSRFFREVFLCEESAFIFWRKVRMYLDPEELLGSHHDRRFVLYTHAFPEWNLNVADISSLPLQIGATATLDLSTTEGLTSALFRDAASVSVMGSNALHLACRSRNGRALDQVLQVLYLHGGASCTLQLLQQVYREMTPICWAMNASWGISLDEIFNLLETLLKVESQRDESTDDTFLHCQWLHAAFTGRRARTVMTMAMNLFEHRQDMFCRLLDAHKPCKIDAQTKYGKTALHCAAGLVLPKVVKKLVKECYATVDIPNINGETPLDIARRSLESSKYFERLAREAMQRSRAELRSRNIDSIDSDSIRDENGDNYKEIISEATEIVEYLESVEHGVSREGVN